MRLYKRKVLALADWNVINVGVAKSQNYMMTVKIEYSQYVRTTVPN